MTQVDPAFEVLAIRRHVLKPDRVVEARAWPPYGGDYEVTRTNEGYVRPHSFDLTEAFVANDQKLVPIRCCAVLGGIDLAVRSVHADAEYFHEHPAPVWNVRH